MRLVDADKLPYSDIKTNEYGYVETTKTAVLKEDIANAQTVQAIPIDRIKQAREEIENIEPLDFLEITKQIGSNGQEMEISKKFAIAILDNLIAESED